MAVLDRLPRGKPSYGRGSVAGITLLQEEIHDHFLHGAVQILEQSALQVKIRLGAGEEVLNQCLESWAAANKIDHARRNGAEQEPAQENAFRERRAELQVRR